jgi:beta-glucanase (GH16 family)
MNRRTMMLMTGIGLLAAAIPAPLARAVPPPDAGSAFIPFGDEFDGPPGSPPDPTKWTVSVAREMIRNPAIWDRPENMGQYRDDRRNVFLDGNSNLVLRATREGNRYFGGRIQSNHSWWGGMGHTWEARIKLECLTAGCWPAWWVVNDDPNVGGEVDLLEWFGNSRDGRADGGWLPGTTVHTRLDGRTRVNTPIAVDDQWHTWRMQWDEAGMRFWKDWAPGMAPYFDVRAGSVPGWPFNNPGYQMYPVLNLAVSGSGGGDPRTGIYPAQMLVDYVRVW